MSTTLDLSDAASGNGSGAARDRPVRAENLSGQDTVEHFIREYPNQPQVVMMTAWLDEHEPGTFRFTGLVDPTDKAHEHGQPFD